MNEEEYRYYRLLGNAKLENNLGQQVQVTFIDSTRKPSQPPLFFDSPLRYHTSDLNSIQVVDAANLPPGGIEKEINFTAAFDKKWFDDAVAHGFKFFKADGTTITSFLDLTMPNMSVVRPKI